MTTLFEVVYDTLGKLSQGMSLEITDHTADSIRVAQEWKSGGIETLSISLVEFVVTTRLGSELILRPQWQHTRASLEFRHIINEVTKACAAGVVELRDPAPIS
jgi:hypothetical protein